MAKFKPFEALHVTCIKVELPIRNKSFFHFDLLGKSFKCKQIFTYCKYFYIRENLKKKKKVSTEVLELYIGPYTT